MVSVNVLVLRMLRIFCSLSKKDLDDHLIKGEGQYDSGLKRGPNTSAV